MATDPHGNTDRTPETRTFTVTAPGTGGPGGPGGPGGVTGGPGGPRGPGGTGDGTSTSAGTPQRVDALVQSIFSRFGRRTRVDKLTVLGAPRGATIAVTCKATHRACPFKRVRLASTGRKLTLAKRFKRRKLRAGTVITVAISKPGLLPKTLRYTLRPTKFPAVRII